MADDGTITATVPPLSAGVVDVTVSGPGGTSAPAAFTHEGVARPVVTSLSPDSGPASGWTTVQIHGRRLDSVSRVTFGGRDAAYFYYGSGGSLYGAALHATQAGPVDLVVHTSLGASEPVTFTYTGPPPPAITSMTPNSGTVAGGEYVEIHGSGFTEAYNVSFGSASASPRTCPARWASRWPPCTGRAPRQPPHASRIACCRARAAASGSLDSVR